MADEKPKKKIMRHASGLKALRQSIVRRDQNFKVRSEVRTLTKNVLKAIADKKADLAKTAFLKAQAAWQRASNRGIFHKNAAKRNIGKMASRLAALK